MSVAAAFPLALRMHCAGLIAGLALAGCGSHQPHAPASAPGEAPAPITNRIAIPAAVRSNLGITFANAEYRVVAKSLRLPGRFEADAGAERQYPAPIAGAVELLVAPYQQVRTGVPLYRLSGSAWLRLRAQWLEAELHAADSWGSAARRDLLRGDLLRMAGMPALNQANAASAAQHAVTLDALRSASELTVYARADGVVMPTIASQGSAVEEHTVVLTTLDPQRIRLRAAVLHGDLARLDAHAPARLLPASDLLAQGLLARWTHGLEADASTRTSDLIAWPQAQSATAALPIWARPGMAGVLELVLAGGSEDLCIPRRATIRDGLKTVFFRRDPADPDKVIRQDADLGAEDGVYVVIKSGLRDGDAVVLDGVYELLLSGGGSPQKPGHFHADGTFHEGADH